MMKKTGLLIGFVFGIFCLAWAQTDKGYFEDCSLAEALKKSVREEKKVMLYCHSKWCGACRLMEKQVLPDTSVASFYKKNFICLTMDLGEGDGLNLAQKYGVSTFPAFLFLDARGEIIHRVIGFKAVPDFIQAGEIAKDMRFSLANMNKRFEEGDREEGFLLDYYKTLRAALDNRCQEVAELYVEKTGYRERFRQGERELVFMEQYARVLEVVGNQKDLSEFIPVYLTMLTPDQLATNRNWKWLSYFRDLSAPIRMVVENPFYFETAAGGIENVRRFVDRVLQNETSKYMQALYIPSLTLDINKCDSLVAYLRCTASGVSSRAIAELSALKCLKSADYKGMVEWLKKAKTYNVVGLSEAGSDFLVFLEKLRECEDRQLVAESVSWMKPFMREIRDDDTRDRFVALLNDLSDKINK